MKKGFYGGTFNPIHFGHINLALQMKEQHGLDEILICPAAQSPFKEVEVSVEHRFAMAKLAIEGIPGFKILDLEAKRLPPSYTIDTLRHLKAQDQNGGAHNDYFLIMGGDSPAEFPRWKEPLEILKIAPLLIGKRKIEQDLLPKDAPPWLKEAVKKGETPMPVFEISGTEIRKRLKHKLYCGHLLPQKVLDYILYSHLY